MRTAIIGCGFIAEVHARALKELGHDLVFVVGSNARSAGEFARKYGVGHFGDDFEAALGDIDCVHICTPPTLHYKMAKAALLAGKHVVCEKPMCLDPGEAKELMLLAKEKGLVGAVNFNVRFHDGCSKAKEMIKAPDFGRVCMVHGSYLQEFHALPDVYGWRYKPELAGQMRAVTEIGSHWIDIVRFLTGLEFAEVSANFGYFTPERYLRDGMMYADKQEGSAKITVDTEDAAVVSVRFSNGAIGNLLLSEISHGRSNSINVEVSSAEKSVWWTSEHPYHIYSSRKNEGVTARVNAFGGGFPDTFKSFFEEVYKDIVKGSASEIPSYPTFYDGYINSAVCAAIYESAKNNSKWIQVEQVL